MDYQWLTGTEGQCGRNAAILWLSRVNCSFAEPMRKRINLRAMRPRDSSLFADARVAPAVTLAPDQQAKSKCPINAGGIHRRSL
jgi:hypothetical protein